MANNAWVRGLRTPVGVVAAVLLFVIVADMVIAPIFFSSRATQIDAVNALRGVSSQHWLGTDSLGRDVLARTLVAARLSVTLALTTTLLATVIGLVLGSLPIVVGRAAGRTIVWFINLLVAFPGLLLALFLSLVLGVGANSATIALAIAFAPSIARLTYTTASSISNADYVSAARLLGVSPLRLLRRHIIPNIAEPLIVNSATVVGFALLSFSALSYLGLGVQDPSYDWGRMLSDGLNDIYTDPAAALAPCVAIVIAGTAFILLGEVGAGTFATRLSRGRAEGAAPSSSTVRGPLAAVTVDESASTPVLRVEGLTVGFPSLGDAYVPVRDVSFSAAPGEVIGIVGESGSGKSMMASAVSDLLPAGGSISASRFELDGRKFLEIGRREKNRLLGTSVAMVFQDPMSALNPALRVGTQLAEVSTVHQGLTRREAMSKAVSRLESVKISEPERRARQFPNEFSGGMRQRAMIGMGLMAEPSLIVADEPTTALDVTVQREILGLIRHAAGERGAAVLFISHDIAVISQIASRVIVMYAGQVVEDLPLKDLKYGAAHPYTKALVASVPDMTTNRQLPLVTIDGRPPQPGSVSSGCAFAERCPFADEQCRQERPRLSANGPDRRVACWHPQATVTDRDAVANNGMGSTR